MQIEFEKKLLEFGLSYGVNYENFYTILSQSGGENHIIIRLISSLPINKQVRGSKNGNEVQAVGRFKFKFLASRLEPDIFVFALQNPVKYQVEFLIVPSKEFWDRHLRMNFKSVCHKSMEMVIWLMQDGTVFDTTNISPEGEWFFMSKGVNGRVADGAGIDYSEYLNSWRGLIVP